MRFWDTSALLPLLVDEPARERLLGLLEEDSEVLAWWGTPVEIASAVARREREGLLTADEVAAALAGARVLADGWHEIVPSDAVRRTAERLPGGRLGRPLRGTVRAMIGVLSLLQAAGESRFSNDTPARGIPQLMQKRGLASFR